ncbi:MAG: DUF4386 family protein [Anaerolineae bacterium]|nr:DUF4386 family protein [Anaerolineae bacterium]
MSSTIDDIRHHSNWKTLYRIGGTAPLITLSFYLIEMFAIIFGKEPFPTATEEWFLLFQQNRILGLLYINALDTLSIAILGLMFLALYVALRKVNEPVMTIAAFFALIGIPVFIVPRVVLLSAVSLSDQYAAATSETQRTALLAVGDMLTSLGMATPQTLGFFFIAIAGLLISIIMLRSDTFTKAAAYTGIAAGIFTIAGDAVGVIASSFANILMLVNMLLWLVWWIMISVGLFRLAKEQI